MIKPFFSLIICTLFSNLISAQNYNVINVDASKFPLMEAQFFVNDAYYNKNSLTVNDINIVENNQTQEIKEFLAPKFSLEKSSIVLVLDISGSMEGKRMEVLKKTAKQFIASIPIDITEIAIAKFNSRINIVCDYTQNITNLNKYIDNLYAVGGTNFHNAFLTPYIGALDITKNAQFKKVIIFISDGQNEIKKHLIANKAIADSIIVNCITIGLPMSSELEHIANETGGQSYGKLVNEKEISKALEHIYQSVQINSIGKIKWVSNYSCRDKVSSTISINEFSETINYTIPAHKTGKISVYPSTVYFNKGTLDSTQYKSIFVYGNNIKANITNVSNTNSKVFNVDKGTLPLTTDINQVKEFNISFSPQDSLYTTSTFTLKNPGCPDILVEAISGGTKKLKITNPVQLKSINAGELLPIKWRGIEKKTPVLLSYQTQKKGKWIKIGEYSDHKYLWSIPTINDSLRIKGQVTNNITLVSMTVSPVKVFEKELFKKAFYNADGTEFITLTKNGTAKSWNANNGTLRFSFEGKHFNDIAYFPDYNRVISINKGSFTVHTNRNGMAMKTIQCSNKKALATFTHSDNKAILAPTFNYSTLTNTTETLQNLTSSLHGNYALSVKDLQLVIYNKHSLKKHFKIKLKSNFKRAILHPSKNLLVIENKETLALYNLENKQIIKEIQYQTFEQFTESGKHFITTNATKTNFYNSETGALLTSIPYDHKYLTSNNGTYLAHSLSDSLFVYNFKDKNRWVIENKLEDEIIKFFPKSNKLLYQKIDSLCIYNLDSKTSELSTKVEQELLKYIDISPSENELLLTSNNLVSIWNIEEINDVDTTPYFKIITHYPTIAQKHDLGKEVVGHAKEVLISELIKNNNHVPIIIDSIKLSQPNPSFAIISYNKGIVVEKNAKALIEIRFSPKTMGDHSALLTIWCCGKRFSCNLYASGIKTEYELTNTLVDFGKLAINSEKDTSISILRNTGTEEIWVKIASSKQVNFKIPNLKQQYKLLPGEVLSIKTRFKPNIRGLQSNQISLKINDETEILGTTLIGFGNAKRKVTIHGKVNIADSSLKTKFNVVCTELSTKNIVYNEPYHSTETFNFKLNTDLNYSIYAEAIGYFSSSENIDLRSPQFYDTIFVNLNLTALNQNEKVALNNIFFESGEAELLEISIAELNRLVYILNQNEELKIEIHGHTDNLGNPDKNMLLSEKRALAVSTYLIKKGLKSNRVTIKYFGETKAISTNSTANGRKANRRVEIKFIQ